MRELSTYIAGALARPLPESVSEKAKLHILDTIAAMISGSRLLPGERAIAYVRSLGGVRASSVVATKILTSPVHAALANGMLAHADETDDSHAPSRTHPGCAVVPAALAVGECVHASGEDMIRAIVLGYDVAARVNYALEPDALAFAAHGTHSIGGTFGAGAAAGALLRLNEQQARHMLSFAAQQASGIGSHVRDAEHIEKAFDFGGMPARNGVAAAEMVKSGMTGVEDVFSGERNFFDAYSASPKPARLSEELGQRFEILATNIKKWPVGSPAQAALDALTSLMEGDAIAPAAIDSIEVQLPGRSARTVDNAPAPNLNLQHLMAMLLVDGGLSFASIHDCDRMADRRLRELRSRITLVQSEELAKATPRRQAIVAITLRDGRALSKRVFAVRGTADNPMTRAELEAKATGLIAEVFGTRRAKAAVDTIARLEAVDDCVRLRRLWKPAAEGTRVS